MGTMKTPGVYILEKNAFPNSVVEVATAVPAFIGYTEKAVKDKKSLANKPIRITSMAEYHNYFGLGPTPTFFVKEFVGDGTDEKLVSDLRLGETDYTLERSKFSPAYRLYYSMKMFFQNGGGPCYIVSIGTYKSGEDAVDAMKVDELKMGISKLLKEQEPTMVVIPDAVSLNASSECFDVQQTMLAHCGDVMKSRFALLDIYDGAHSDQDNECIKKFRQGIIGNRLDFGAAYYPWLKTNVVADYEVSFMNLSRAEGENDVGGAAKLVTIIKEELGLTEAKLSERDKEKNEKVELVTKEDTYKDDALCAELDKSLKAISDEYKMLLKEIQSSLNLMPPSGAMAGIYTAVDNARGVWKAPANVGVSGVTAPSVEISDDEQENLNVDVNGKSVNAIRTFIGEGTLVWGARTLDGNSLDWRYINVRRTMIMLQQSIKLATKAYVFEANDAQTWVTIKSMISNFLTGIWKRGGLAGASASDAFSVHVGLGETMTPEDILEGILRVSVLVAITRPAEFIEITFKQQMQKS
jgi:phage tail sheath protein FI